MRHSLRTLIVAFVMLAGVAGLGLAAPHHASAGYACYAWVQPSQYSYGGASAEGGASCSYALNYIDTQVCVLYYSSYYGAYEIAGCYPSSGGSVRDYNTSYTDYWVYHQFGYATWAKSRACIWTSQGQYTCSYSNAVWISV